MGDFEHEVLNHLSMLSFEVADEDKKKTEFYAWEEAETSTVSWPVTTAASWCGEFARGKARCA
jgi:hypothetical protein